MNIGLGLVVVGAVFGVLTGLATIFMFIASFFGDSHELRARAAYLWPIMLILCGISWFLHGAFYGAGTPS